LVTDVLIAAAKSRPGRPGPNVRKITFAGQNFAHFAALTTVPPRRRLTLEDAVMKARFKRRWALANRANLALALTLLTGGSALADIATPEQKRACTPDVYRLCAGEIPNVRAITACLRRQKANLSEACRAVFEQ
jgi:hypothetical protein